MWTHFYVSCEYSWLSTSYWIIQENTTSEEFCSYSISCPAEIYGGVSKITVLGTRSLICCENKSNLSAIFTPRKGQFITTWRTWRCFCGSQAVKANRHCERNTRNTEYPAFTQVFRFENCRVKMNGTIIVCLSEKHCEHLLCYEA